MSDNAKHYDHYKVEGPATKALIESFDAIDTKRKAIIGALQDEFGAVAHSLSSGFGDKGARVRSWYGLPTTNSLARSLSSIVTISTAIPLSSLAARVTPRKVGRSISFWIRQ